MKSNRDGNREILRRLFGRDMDNGDHDKDNSDWDMDNGDHDKDNSDWDMDNGGWSMSRLSPRASALGQSPSAGGRRVVTLGWHPDPPDHRDICLMRPSPPKLGRVIPGNKKAGKREAKCLARVATHAPGVLNRTRLPNDHYCNIAHCSPVEDQGQIGSCTAQAVVGLMEYIMRHHGDDHIDGSRLFLYKVTRQLMGLTGDTGAYLRTAIKAAAAIGVPPERYWEYDVSRYDDEPSPFVYTYATNFKALDYARLDAAWLPAQDLLALLKRTLAEGHCIVFGFTVFSSLSNKPDIPFPGEQDEVGGGHAVMAVGFDDNRKNVGTPNKGALLIRNSWGASWGVEGYGFLPYDYVYAGLARDFWVCFAWDWLETVDGE